MSSCFVINEFKNSGTRILDKNLLIPKIRAEFYVRLYSYLLFEPEIFYEGYEFHIKDLQSGIAFSAGLTGFGLGYFGAENSENTRGIISELDKLIFDSNLRTVK
jgi:hypothetical protein